MPTPRKATAAAKKAPAKEPTPPTTDDDGTPPWIDPATGEALPVFRLIAAVVDELPAIGKNRENKDQHFMFRGHDDVLREINPLFSKYAIFPAPHVLERITGTRPTRSGGVQYEINLHVEYTFHGPRGDTLTADAWGEGVDSGDKGTNKAMTNAMKNVLNQVFAIATEEAARWDSDQYTPEETVAAPTQIRCGKCFDTDGTEYLFPPADVDPEPLRQHMIDMHGYTRLEDGRVAPPTTTDDAPATDATPPQDAEPSPEPAPADDAPQTDTEPAEAPEPGPSDPAPKGNPEIGEDELAWIDAMKGQDLVAQLAKLGLPVGGRVADMKERLKDFMRGGGSATPDADPEPEGEVEAPTEPEPTPEPEPEPEAEGEGSDDDGGYQCPECDAFPFSTEQEYTEHWYEVHAEADAPDEGAEDVNVSDEVREELRGMVTGLRGAAARAYGEYRRKSKLPTKIEDMTGLQVIHAMQFIEELEDAS